MRYGEYSPYIGESWVWPAAEALKIFRDSLAPQLLQRKTKTTVGEKLFPEDHLVFRAFRDCPYDKVQLVVIGQQPYAEESLCTGLAFDAPKAEAVPHSLRNILNEIQQQCGESRAILNEHSYLEHLPPQGVLLWNMSLTAEEGAAGAHCALWQPFVEAMVGALNKKPYLVWALWGKSARTIEPLISPKHCILATDYHPNPFGYNQWKTLKVFHNINNRLKGNKIFWWCTSTHRHRERSRIWTCVLSSQASGTFP